MSYTPHERFVKQNRINRTRGWAVFNWGVLWSFERTRKQAIAEAEERSGRPWSELKGYCEVRKAELVLEATND